MRLALLSPLYFDAENVTDPFAFRDKEDALEGGEKLFCFELDEAQYRSFEPDKVKLLGNPVFGPQDGGMLRELPQGDYLFAQKRKIMDRGEIIDLAVEMQNEGLWQRLGPGKRLYLRYLFEDSCWVTQLFRPYT